VYRDAVTFLVAQSGGGALQFVMVPVPEELAEQVLEYLRWISTLPSKDRKPAAGARLVQRAPRARARDDDPLVRTWGELDDDSRAILVAVAAATLDRRQITVADLAGITGLVPREIAGIAFELNQVLAAQAAIQLTVLIKPPDSLPPGPLDWEQQVMAMRVPVAQSILAAARAYGES